ncbi:MAG: hypothetical protein JRI23_11370 [Deltaproteobacteria bacterium]|jgi:hypothetical protein|nr:hypothetical protein [Deltaproteobacteria bacterium]MBW2532297.1 hypothetical protein [Deltaproteobacteria bacterium]
MKHTNWGLGALLPLMFTACAGEEPPEDYETPPPRAVEIDPSRPAAAPASCDEATASHSMGLAQTNLVFLLDRSSSMHKSIGGNKTRWTATRKGLFTILDALPADTWGGLSMFPAGDEPRACCIPLADHTMDCSTCEKADRPSSEVRCDPETYLEIPSGMAPLSDDHIQLIKTTVRADDELNYWGTPMAAALSGVIDGVSTAPPPGVTSIVLLTDGLPGACSTQDDSGANDLDRVLEAAKAGQSVGIRTFVVGIDSTDGAGDDERSLAANLSPMAVAGGTARYLGCEESHDCAYMVDVTNFEQSLDEALHQVALLGTGCAFDMPEVTGGTANLDETAVSVVIDAGVTAVSRDTSHVNGWDVVPSGEQVQLYGAACDLLKTHPDAVVEIVVGCDPS